MELDFFFFVVVLLLQSYTAALYKALDFFATLP